MTDAELCIAAQRGDVRAADTLVRRHLGTARRSYGSIFALHGSDADDLEQEARIGILRAIRTWKPGHAGPFEAFVSMCVRRTLSEKLRLSASLKHEVLNGSARVHHLDSGDVIDATEAVADPRLDPLQIACDRETLREIGQAVAGMSELERRALIGNAIGETYEEIAQDRGASWKTVDNALQRARRKLAA